MFKVIYLKVKKILKKFTLNNIFKLIKNTNSKISFFIIKEYKLFTSKLFDLNTKLKSNINGDIEINSKNFNDSNEKSKIKELMKNNLIYINWKEDKNNKQECLYIKFYVIKKNLISKHNYKVLENVENLNNTTKLSYTKKLYNKFIQNDTIQEILYVKNIISKTIKKYLILCVDYIVNKVENEDEFFVHKLYFWLILTVLLSSYVNYQLYIEGLYLDPNNNIFVDWAIASYKVYKFYSFGLSDFFENTKVGMFIQIFFKLILLFTHFIISCVEYLSFWIEAIYFFIHVAIYNFIVGDDTILEWNYFNIALNHAFTIAIVNLLKFLFIDIINIYYVFLSCNYKLEILFFFISVLIVQFFCSLILFSIEDIMYLILTFINSVFIKNTIKIFIYIYNIFKKNKPM